MAKSMKEVLAERQFKNFVGREQEVETLFGYVGSAEPSVVHVHGLAGIGKTVLMRLFVAKAQEKGYPAYGLDCRHVEPSKKGLLESLGDVSGTKFSTVDEAANFLDERGERVILALDTYEIFRMMDTWFRNEFVPSLPESVRVFFFAREQPVPAWLIAPEWQGIFHSILLGPLEHEAAIDMLQKAGVSQSDIPRITRFTNGHPLALRLSAAAVLEQPDIDLETIASQTVVSELAKAYISYAHDPATQRAIQASSVVRRMNESLLNYMLPESVGSHLYDALQALSFVETAKDGLVIHDAVQQTVASALKTSNPTLYRDLRKAAWKFYRNEVRIMARSEIWRYSADMLYMVEEDLVHDAFFPSNLQPYAIEEAVESEGQAIKEIIARFEGKDGQKILNNWWRHAPQCFHTIHDPRGVVAGFYLLYNLDEVNIGVVRDDPVAWRLYKQIQDDPVPPKQKAIFCRRWLDAETGEALSPVIRAGFLDVKGYYVAMKPSLRRLYCTRTDYLSYAPLFQKLQFKYLADCATEVDGNTYHTDMLDFGPVLFNGWITGLVGSELGIDKDDLLDVDACELVVDGNRVAITPLELGVMQYLQQHEGDVVNRETLLESVWGYGDHTGSNVVDTKIRSLRKKLGQYSPMIETVSGVGYRFKRI